MEDMKCDKCGEPVIIVYRVNPEGFNGPIWYCEDCMLELEEETREHSKEP